MNLGASGAWEKLGYGLWRAALPGGWLIATFAGGGGAATSTSFVPDPTHAWDGRALWGAGARWSRQDGSVSVVPDRDGSD